MSANPPLALIASSNEWLARSFESVLGSNGYAVQRAYTPGQALEHARMMQPDAIFIDTSFRTESDGIDLCRTLRGDPFLPPNAPIMLIATGPASRQERLEALRAGAWEVFGLPLDAEALLLQLGTYVTARVAADRAQEESLLDPFTGLYNMRGLLRRVRELGAAALRHHHPLACIVFGPTGHYEEEAGEMELSEAAFPAGQVAHLFRDECRAGDAVGRLGPNEFVVLAPDTGPAGALTLARRITAAADLNALDDESGSQLQMRAGLFAVPDFAAAEVQPVEMLVRATMALRRSRSGLTSGRIVSFDTGDPAAVN